MITVLARKPGAALVIRNRVLGIFTPEKGFTPVDFKPQLAMKLAAQLNYTPVLPAQEMEETDLAQFLLPPPRGEGQGGGFGSAGR